MRSAWKVMNLAHAGVSVPPLIIKFVIGTSDYTVWVTDLTLIWKESLDRKRIIRRSLDVDTSIDPSEDSDQLRLFLQRVGDALEQQPGTTLDLVQNDNDQSLLLQTFTPLPGSLKPLEWSIALLPAPQSTLTAELIVPMLSQQMIANAEKASLLQQLKEKDQVIVRLMDKMQLDGVDLGRLFPGVASKSSKSISRQALAKSVKGLGEFDEHQWRNHLTSNLAPATAFVDLVSDISNIDLGGQPEFAQSPDYKKWWETLSHQGSQSKEPVRDLLQNDAEEGFTHDEFQRQLTPTNKRITPSFHETGEKSNKPWEIKAKALGQANDISDSTTDESDQDLQSARVKPTSFNKHSIGRDIVSSSPRESSRTSSPTYLGKQANKETHQKQMSLRGASTPRDQVSSSGEEVSLAGSGEVEGDKNDRVPAVLKPRAKLGKIGGKGKADKGNESQSYTSPAPPAVAVLSSYSNLSASNTDIGPVSKIVAESERSGRPTVHTLAPSRPHETSQERANRNRERLKRELESKSQTGAKKKRKF